MYGTVVYVLYSICIRLYFYGLSEIKAKMARIALKHCNTDIPHSPTQSDMKISIPSPQLVPTVTTLRSRCIFSKTSLTLLSLALTCSFWNDDISENPTDTFPKMWGWCASPHDRPIVARPSLGISLGVLGLDFFECVNASTFSHE